MLPVAALYGVLAVILIWLGVGSIMARRWARALLAIWSWSWLAMGLISCVAMALMASHFAEVIRAAQPPGQPPLSSGARTALMLVPIVMLGFLFILLPLIWGLFYSGRNVKATCEARDPVVRWTDRCPLPVLAVSLWLAFGTLSMLVMPVFHSGVRVAPLFGFLLSGVAGTVFYIALSAVWGYAAWAVYRLEWRGWWVVFLALILFGLSNAITYSVHDLSDVYALMGYPPAQVEQMRTLGFSGRSPMAWLSAVFILPLLGYLWYVRRFFRRDGGV
ncbi:MAG: hypothetical protein ABI946_06675 [Chthoniobacterales bacterium]